MHSFSILRKRWMPYQREHGRNEVCRLKSMNISCDFGKEILWYARNQQELKLQILALKDSKRTRLPATNCHLAASRALWGFIP